MSKPDSFLVFLTDQLACIPSLSWKAMFGGYGLYAAECFFAIVFRKQLYFKTDTTTEQLYLDRGMRAFQPNPRQLLRHYFEVPVDVVEDNEALCLWARRAIAVGRNNS